jgi:hypothetical protein
MQHRRQNTRHASLMTLDSQPGQPSRNRCADRRIESKLSAASLPGVPDGADLLRIGDGFALGLGALGLSGGTCGCALSFLRSAVRAHGARLAGLPTCDKAIISPCR